MESKPELVKYFTVSSAEAPPFFPSFSWYSQTFDDDGETDRGDGRSDVNESNNDGNGGIDDVDNRHHICTIALELALADVMVVGTSTKGSYPTMLGALAVVIAHQRQQSQQQQQQQPSQQQQQPSQQQNRINNEPPPPPPHHHHRPLGVVVSICTTQSMEAKRQVEPITYDTLRLPLLPYLLTPTFSFSSVTLGTRNLP